MQNELLILGNGFDLECGLKSKFEDFFKARYYQNEKCMSWDDFKKTSTDANIWDTVLLTQKMQNLGQSWSNFENYIFEYLCYRKEHPGNFSTMNEHLNDPINIIETLDNGCIVSGLSPIKELKKLRKDLVLLEKSFAEYINRQIDDEYTENASINLRKIRRNMQSDSKLNILSFNYTTPFEKTAIASSCRNIHGKACDYTAIFGFDIANIYPNQDDEINSEERSEITKFTKTYRLLDTSSADVYELSDEETVSIHFYGHSLSNSDYSYFQALFDSISLRNSNTKLVFYYKVVFKEETIAKIFNLINRYSMSIDNEEHRKNLLHKLLLENRLQLVDFDSLTQK
jgi:hypothetical protein